MSIVIIAMVVVAAAIALAIVFGGNGAGSNASVHSASNLINTGSFVVEEAKRGLTEHDIDIYAGYSAALPFGQEEFNKRMARYLTAVSAIGEIGIIANRIGFIQDAGFVMARFADAFGTKKAEAVASRAVELFLAATEGPAGRQLIDDFHTIVNSSARVARDFAEKGGGDIAADALKNGSLSLEHIIDRFAKGGLSISLNAPV